MNYLLQINTLTLWLVLSLSISTVLHAQEPSFVQLNKDPKFRIISAEEQYVAISFLIKDGYHIQADKVKDGSLIPSELAIEGPEDITLGRPIFPQAVKFKMEGVEEPLYVFGDVLEIKVPVKLARNVDKGQFIFKGKLYYQACNAFKCYFPRELPFTIEIGFPE